MSLLYGNRLNVAVFTDFAKGQKKKLEELKKSQLLKERHIMIASDFNGAEEADIEDLLGWDAYVFLVKRAYSLPDTFALESHSNRVLKDVEDQFRTLPPTTPEFDHFTPSAFLLEHPELIDQMPDSADALSRFEALFVALNALL